MNGIPNLARRFEEIVSLEDNPRSGRPYLRTDRVHVVQRLMEYLAALTSKGGIAVHMKLREEREFRCRFDVFWGEFWIIIRTKSRQSLVITGRYRCKAKLCCMDAGTNET